MKIEVRRARREDADAICDAHVAAWRTGYARVFPAAVLHGSNFDVDRRTRWRAWTHSATPDQRMIVGIADGRVVGFAHTGNGRDESAGGPDGTSICGELYGFYLHPDVWGSGVATVMMDAAVEHLAQLRPLRAVLWTLRDARRARAFYEKAGWTPSGRTDTLTMYPDHPVEEVEYQRFFDHDND